MVGRFRLSRTRGLHARTFPRVFSFNSPLGACPDCQGIGVQRRFSEDLVVDGTLTIEQGAVLPWRQSMSPAWYKRLMIQVAEHYGIPTRTPFDLLDEDHRDILLHGSGSTVIHFHFESDNGSVYQMNRPWEGIIARLEKTYTETTSERTRARLIACMTDLPCPSCHGEKLNPAARASRWAAFVYRKFPWPRFTKRWPWSGVVARCRSRSTRSVGG